MSEVVVRRLGAADVAMAQAQVAYFWDVTPPEIVIQTFLAQQSNIFLSAEVETTPVGQAIGYLLPRWDQAAGMAFLYSIDVDESVQRQGIATRLMAMFERICREAGCGEGFVFTNANNTPAMALYEKMGGVRPNPDDVMWDFAWTETPSEESDSR